MAECRRTTDVLPLVRRSRTEQHGSVTEYVIVLVLVVAVAAAIAAVRRLTDDGGPRPEPLPRPEDEWFPGLPSHPYAANH
jgi:hypothetical protein